MIETVHISGYKCLRDVSVTLAPFTVLIGPNDSGKTSFLNALAVPWHPTASLPEGASIKIAGGDATVDVVFSAQRISASYRSSTFENSLGVFPADAKLRTALPGVYTTQPLVLDARRICNAGIMSNASLDHIVHHHGHGIAAHMARLALSDRKRLDLIQTEMQRITNGRVADCLIIDNAGGQYSLSFRLHDGTVIPGSELSAGLLMYLGFLAILHHDEAPGVLLVEEPENGLHPLRLHEVVRLLRELTRRGTQVICTTHSPDLLSACEPEEVRVFLRPDPDSGTTVRTLPDHFDRIRMRQSIGEVWASRGEEGLLDMLPPVEPTVHAEAS